MDAAALKADQGTRRPVENRVQFKGISRRRTTAGTEVPSLGQLPPRYLSSPGRAQHHCTHPVPGLTACCYGDALPDRNPAKPTKLTKTSHASASHEPETATALPEHRSQERAASASIFSRQDSRGVGAPSAQLRNTGDVSKAASGHKRRGEESGCHRV